MPEFIDENWVPVGDNASGVSMKLTYHEHEESAALQAEKCVGKVPKYPALEIDPLPPL